MNLKNASSENRKQFQIQTNKQTHSIYNVWVTAHNVKVILQMHLEAESTRSNRSLYSVLLCKA